MKATAESTRFIIGGLTGGFTQKIGQLKNSESFRSLEEKVGSAYENVKVEGSALPLIHICFIAFKYFWFFSWLF